MRNILIALATSTALASFAVAPAAADSQASKPSVSIGGVQMSAKDIKGRVVVTAEGERIGHVADLISRGNTPNDVVIALEAENSQMGMIPAREGTATRNARSEPVVAGGRTVAVPADSLRAGDGRTLVIDQSALTTIAELKDRLRQPGAGAAAGASSATGASAYTWQSGAELKVDQVIGAPVYDRSGSRVGEIAALVTKSEDKLTYAVVDVGSDRKVTMPWNKMSARQGGDGLTSDDAEPQRLSEARPFTERNPAYRNMPGEDVVRWPQGQAKASR